MIRKLLSFLRRERQFRQKARDILKRPRLVLACGRRRR